jgi:hypothetical protein
MLGACSGSASEPVTTDRAAQFDGFWAAYNELYPAFALKGVDWVAQRTAFRDRATATPSTAALVTVLREMIAPLNDGHADFIAPDGTRRSSRVMTSMRCWTDSPVPPR